MPTVLLIEDDEDIRNNVKEILSLAQHCTVTASNGLEGIETALRIHPDLIISDVMMPGIDGFGVLHILKKDPKSKDIPFIFLTSKGDYDDMRQAITLGANDYITKPFEGIDLLNAVEKRLQQVAQQHAAPTDEQQLVQQEESTSLVEKDPLTTLLSEQEVIELKKKHVIYKEGSTPRYLYYIQSGKVKTLKNHEDGKEIVIGLYGAGDYLGYPALLENTFNAETAEVLEDCELVMIPRAKFEQVLEKHPAVMKLFLNLLAKNLMEKERQVVSLAYSTLRQKVAEMLILLDSKYNHGKHAEFYINMGREDLASIAGTATESLIRTLTEFKHEKLIDIQNGNIVLINKTRLAQLKH